MGTMSGDATGRPRPGRAVAGRGLRLLLLAMATTSACFAKDCSCDQDPTRPGCQEIIPLPSPEPCRTVVFVATDTFDRGDSRWTSTAEATSGFQGSVLFQPSGGNPGGYRRMTHVLSGRGLIVV